MEVMITTLGRVGNQRTLSKLSPYWRDRVHLVVQAHEVDAHKEAYPDVHVFALPESIKNLGQTREYLVRNVEADKLILLDDDLKMFRRVPDDWRLKELKGDPISEIFDAVDKALDEFVHMSISPRGGNQNVPEDFLLNVRYMRFLAYRPKDIPADVEIGRLDGMSDFDTNLQLLRRGYPNMVFYCYSQDHRGTNYPGGCALTRTLESHAAEARKLKELHPDFVTLRTVKNRTGKEYGMATRLDVTVKWKKAYASYQG